MKIYIREVCKRDNRELAKMIRGVFIEYKAPQEGTVFVDPTTDNLYELFRTPGSLLWVAEKEGKALGCCGIFPTEGLPDKCVELVKFYIDHDIRGEGIGRLLMQKAIESAKE